jgi:hypothetical protein
MAPGCLRCRWQRSHAGWRDVVIGVVAAVGAGLVGLLLAVLFVRLH